MEKAYTENISRIFEKLKTRQEGLTKEEISERREIYGENILPEEKPSSIYKMIWKQINNPLIYVLLFTALFSYSINHKLDTGVILVVVIINVVIGVYHELKAQKIIEGLKNLTKKTCIVRRNGNIKEVETKTLIPGDIVILKDGDKVPADIRVIKANNVNAIEGALTGESVPVSKKDVTLPENTQLGDRENMFFMGTIVGSGEAEGVVVQTGLNTEIGSIAHTLKNIEREKTLFAKRTAKLTTIMTIIATSAAALTFIIGLIRGLELNEVILFTVASFISGIPEGLPAVLTVALSIAAYRLATKKSVVRSLSGVETLSSITTIVTDKTGTLTQNTMTVTRILLGDKREIDVTGKDWEPKGDFLFKKEKINPKKDKVLNLLLPFVSIVNKVELKEKEGNFTILGDPTEGSRLVLGEKGGYIKKEILNNYEILDDIPYDQEKKYRGMILKNKKENKHYAIIVGGAENVLKTCKRTMIENGRIEKIDKVKDFYSETIKEWGKEAMRTQVIAYQELDIGIKKFENTNMKNFTFLSILGINDPVRDNVPKAIKRAQKANIRIIMATGDNKHTAIAVGRKAGIKKPKKGPYALEEKEIENLTDEEFKEVLKTVPIFARVTPKTKYRIAKLLQEEGEIIAMTGDGVNDALALKKANIGISMGIIGTDAAREASDIVIMDDNFATIIDAIEEGLTVFRNLRQTTMYLLSTNLGEDLFIIASLVVGLPLPLLPIHILWLNLLTDGLLDVGLATEKTHKDTWEMGIRDKDEQIIGNRQFMTLALTILMIGTIGLVTFVYFLPEGIDKARTATFVMLTCSQIFFIFSMRSPTISIFKLGFFSNKFLFLSIGLVVILTTMLIEIEFFANIFRFTTLKWSELGGLILFSTIPLFVMEFYKSLKRNGYIPK